MFSEDDIHSAFISTARQAVWVNGSISANGVGKTIRLDSKDDITILAMRTPQHSTDFAGMGPHHPDVVPTKNDWRSNPS